ncbi:hypothetical protein, partial [Klebsiella pneumoniae]|uniref:hypothetical protein n=1 Tax=Klebsiella pneumoniae TaxID=573 RepID=UPI00200D1A70
QYAGKCASDAGASLAVQKATEQIVGNAAKSATVAVVQGRDPLKAALTGGVTAAVPAVLGNVPGFAEFAKSSPGVAASISSGIGAALTGQDVNKSMIG